MKKFKQNINFDDYVENYEELTNKNLRFFNKSRNYFDSYKIKIASKISKKPNKILDFGCGVGLCIPFIKEHFPNSDIYATDTSDKSLNYLARKHKKVNTLKTNDLYNYKNYFDLIIIVGVFHHVLKNERLDLMKEIKSLLKEGGKFIIFEHNPSNFITKKLVKMCPYDHGVELIKMKELIKMIYELNLDVFDKGFTLFFPSFLSYFRKFERYLKSLPMGGQYYIAGLKNEK